MSTIAWAGAKTPTPFASAAPALAALGLACIPCGGQDGKRPTVARFNRWRSAPGREAIERIAAQNPTANVAILTGWQSRIVVVDYDDQDQACRAMREMPSALMVRTPMDGAHHYYLSSGERCANLRPHGLAADLKGQGGFVLECPRWMRQAVMASPSREETPTGHFQICRASDDEAGIRATLWENSPNGVAFHSSGQDCDCTWTTSRGLQP